MEPRSTDTGAELVLDNRKLIVGFVLLVALCGACFIIGFMEGKRQAIQARIESIAPLSAAAGPGATQAVPAAQPPAASGATTQTKDQNARGQLDWYKNVQQGETGAARTPSKKEVVTPAPAASRQGEAKSLPPKVAVPTTQEPGVPAAKVTYSVQVGAFRELKEAETKAASVRQKGFECAIEPPTASNQLYLVKVGQFKSRADAVAMQHKLAKAGFSCFIKSN